jgi:hypothetical protein
MLVFSAVMSQIEPIHVVRIDNLEGLDLLLQFRGPRPCVALKAKRNVFHGQPILALAQLVARQGDIRPSGMGFVNASWSA